MVNPPAFGGTAILLLVIITHACPISYASNLKGQSSYLTKMDKKQAMIPLTPANFALNKDFKALLEKRRSYRAFKGQSLTLNDLSTLLWAAGGKKYDSLTGATRTIPSAGATYPLEFYLVVGKNGVARLKEGIYHYLIEEHALELISSQDKRQDLADACLGQDFIKVTPVSLIIAAKFERTTSRYGARGERYVYMEVGHSAENLYLAVANLNLGTVEVGAFDDDNLAKLLTLDKNYLPLIVMPIGHPTEWGK